MQRSASAESDIVPDSEPEREAQRQQRRREKASRRTAPQRENAVAPKIIVPQVIQDSVIEISDDDSEESTNPKGLLSGRAQVMPDRVSILSISDDTPPPPPARTTKDPIFGHLSMFDSSVEYDDSVRLLDVAKFAFQSRPIPGRPFASSSRSVHTSARAGTVEPTSAKAPALKKPSKPASHRFADEFSDIQLATITTCISCEVKWTVRKSVAQKMLHIQSCSKKRSLTDDTVRERIRQALHAHSTVTTSSSVLSAPKDTILAGVVQDAAPKRARKRAPVVPTVQVPVETMEGIRAKAAAIIQRDVVPSGNKGKARAVDDEDMASLPLPTTQPFAPSKFGTTAQRKPIIYGSSSDSEAEADDTGSPISQVFQTSRLGQQATPPSKTSNAIHWISSSSSSSARSPSPVSSTKKKTKAKAKLPPSYSASDSDVAELPPPSSPLHANEHLEPWDNEDPEPYLHYSPSPMMKPASAGLPTSRIQATVESPVSPKLTSPIKAKSKPAVPKSPRKRKETTTKRTPEVFDEVWEQEVKRRILSDMGLHLRILRLEPVSLDAFVKVVQEPEATGIKPSGKFLTALKAFLDKQAIHFYGGT